MMAGNFTLDFRREKLCRIRRRDHWKRDCFDLTEEVKELCRELSRVEQ
jgi:hypothetical protein